MSAIEFVLARAVLVVVGRLAALMPIDRHRVVLATARMSVLEGNLARIDAAIQRRGNDVHVVHLLEPYSYGLRGKIRYLLRLARGMVHLQRSALFIVDNAYFPIHIAPHRAGTTVVQVWHAPCALKRFGLDVQGGPRGVERRFLHRNYDYVVASSECARLPYAAAFGVAPGRVLPLGLPRADFFADEPAMEDARRRMHAAYPTLVGRRVVLYAPTFRGRGRERWTSTHLDAPALRRLLPPDHVLVLKSHPNLDPGLTGTDGFDIVVDPSTELNDVFTVTDVLVTDYSSSIFEYALLRRPIVLLIPDLADYERDPGLYLDYSTEMIGVQVSDTAGVASEILSDRFAVEAYDAFIARHMGTVDGHASDRFVEAFLGPVGLLDDRGRPATFARPGGAPATERPAR